MTGAKVLTVYHAQGGSWVVCILGKQLLLSLFPGEDKVSVHIAASVGARLEGVKPRAGCRHVRFPLCSCLDSQESPVLPGHSIETQ
jgi:hypothetical protein